MLARGSTINLRRLHRRDLTTFQAYRNDPKVAALQGWEPQSDEQASGFLAHMATAPLFANGEWTQLAIADAKTDVLLGDLGIRMEADGSAAELGISLARKAQGQGHGYEAINCAFDLIFAQTPAQHIQIITDQRNTAALALIRRLGLQKTGEWQAEFMGAPCTELEFIHKRPTP